MMALAEASSASSPQPRASSAEQSELPEPLYCDDFEIGNKSLTTLLSLFLHHLYPSKKANISRAEVYLEGNDAIEALLTEMEVRHTKEIQTKASQLEQIHKMEQQLKVYRTIIERLTEHLVLCNGGGGGVGSIVEKALGHAVPSPKSSSEVSTQTDQNIPEIASSQVLNFTAILDIDPNSVDHGNLQKRNLSSDFIKTELNNYDEQLLQPKKPRVEKLYQQIGNLLSTQPQIVCNSQLSHPKIGTSAQLVQSPIEDSQPIQLQPQNSQPQIDVSQSQLVTSIQRVQSPLEGFQSIVNSQPVQQPQVPISHNSTQSQIVNCQPVQSQVLNSQMTQNQIDNSQSIPPQIGNSHPIPLQIPNSNNSAQSQIVNSQSIPPPIGNSQPIHLNIPNSQSIPLQIGNSQPIRLNIPNSQSIQSNIFNFQPIRLHIPNSQSTQSQFVNLHSINTKISNFQPIRLNISNSQIPNSQIPNSQSISPQIGNSQPIRLQIPNSQIVNSQSIQPQIGNSQPIRLQIPNSQIVNSQSIQPQIGNSQPIRLQIPNSQIVNSQSISPQIGNSQPMRLQIPISQILNSQSIQPQIGNSQPIRLQIPISQIPNSQPTQSQIVNSQSIQLQIDNSHSMPFQIHNSQPTQSQIPNSHSIQSQIGDSQPILEDSKFLPLSDDGTLMTVKQSGMSGQEIFYYLRCEIGESMARQINRTRPFTSEDILKIYSPNLDDLLTIQKLIEKTPKLANAEICIHTPIDNDNASLQT